MGESVVIVIPGTRGLRKWSKTIQLILNCFEKFFRVGVVSIDHPKYWRDNIKFKKGKVVWMHWARGFSKFARRRARRRLERLLRHYGNYNVELVGISIAGDIILDTIKNNKFKNIKKIVLIASVSSECVLNHKPYPIINIYSEEDSFGKFATRVIAPFGGGARLCGKSVKNVKIPSMTHKGFCKNNIIKKGKFKGKCVCEVVNSFL